MLYAENDKILQGNILLRQAVISRFKMADKAEDEYLTKAYRIALELNDSLLMAEVMHEKALSELKRDPQKGLHYMSEALIWLPLQEQDKYGVYQRDLSMFYLTVGDAGNALKTVKQISCKGWNPSERMSLDILKGAIYARLGETDSAKVYFQMHGNSLTLRGKISSCRGLYELYQVSGDANKAVKYAAQYIILKDSLDADRRTELAERIRIVDDLRIQHQRASHAESALSRQKIIFYRIVVCTMFVILILLGRLISVRRKRIRLYERLQTERVARMDESLKRQEAEMALMREQAERKAREVEQLNQTFAKKKDAIFTEIKLTGEQGIYANLKPMNYHYVNELVWVGYSYSLTLGNDTTVTFSFKRNTSKILTNMVRKSFVKRIAIPSDLKEVVNGMAWKWVGDNCSEGEKIEAILEKNTDGYSAFYGTVTEGKNDVLFEGVPAGNYKLILSRYKTAELKEKDGNAGGDFAVVYYDEKQVVVK